MRNFKKGFIASLAFSMLLSVMTITPVQAAGGIEVTQKGNSVVIGNEYVTREFSTENNKLTTEVITNNRTGETPTLLVPESGSEEFIIALLPNEFPSIDRNGWTAVADSYQTNEVNGDGPASNLIDGSASTIWHSRYNNQGVAGDQAYPHNVIFSFAKEETFKAFTYTARSGSTNGRINQYKLYANTTTEKLDFNSADSKWQLISEGTFNYGSSESVTVNLDKAYSATQLKLVAVNEVEGRAFASGAEFKIHADFYNPSSATIKASELELNGQPVVETITKDGKTGKTLTFNFKTKQYEGVDYTISEVITMYNGDSFMRKHLNISVPTDQSANAKISYIDLENMNFAAADLKANEFWTIPEQANNPDMANMKGDFLELGQPYYIGAMYFGSEFPQTENKIKDNNGYIRYWYGKSLAKDPHFEYNKNNTAGFMETWDAVAGAARSRDYLVCQADFYEYIETIATPTDFRQQYNSWYDLMKNVSATNIQDSFYEIEKGFTQYGVNPLDSYVVDDGWMNYSSFWAFNNKFPNELYDASLQVQQLGSDFGLWLGPRGGYGTEGQIASWIANNGYGSRNPQSGNDINISDARYLNKLLSDVFLSYQGKFDINYWKLDGMLLHPATAESEYYVTGNPFYTLSETYERWTDMFENMREERDGEDLWINLTSYLNPSPWYLQWVNSVWMQNTGDCGYTKTYDIPGAETNDSAQALTYRDGSYYNFIYERQWQLPNKYFYNHDPVYGNTAHVPYNRGPLNFGTEGMRDYLFMLGTRGTAFWEYYYSYSMFNDELWQVNAEAAHWIEDNFDILQKSKMFTDGNPRNGYVYGFSCWNGNEGIVSIRNPKNTVQTYTLTYDRLVGVPEDLTTVKGKVVVGDLKWQTEDLEVSYGTEVTYELQPHEVLIVQYGETDTTAPAIDSIHGNGNTLEITFDENIREPEAANISVEGNTVTDVTLKADRKTALVTLKDELAHGANINVTVNNIKDIVGNAGEDTHSDDYYKDDIIATLDSQRFNGSPVTINKDTSVDGHGDFTVTGTIKATSADVNVVRQEGAYTVSIDEDGYLEFAFGDVKANSKYTEKLIKNGQVEATVKGVVADGNEHTFAAVKEVNGMIKLYVDGKLVKSAYDENNVNPELSKGNILVGEGLNGTLKDVKVYDKALSYDIVATMISEDTGDNKITLNKNMLSASSIDDTEAGMNKGLANLLDGDDTTFWATHPNEENSLDTTYLQVDLGEVKEIEKIELSTRYFEGNGYNCTGNINDYIINVSTDGQTWQEVKTGAVENGRAVIEFEPVEAQYIKITATSSYHWQDGTAGRPDNRNTVMCIADIAIYEYIEPELEPSDPAKDVAKDEIASITDGDHHSGDASQGAASSFIYDNKVNTMWHTDWYPQTGAGRDNFYVIFKLNEMLNIDGMRFLQRGDDSPNGKVTKYDLYVSDAAETLDANSDKWVKVVSEGTLSTEAVWQLVNFDAVKVTQVKLQVLDSTGDQPSKAFASLAEVRLTKTSKGAALPTPPEVEVVNKDALEAKVEEVKDTVAGNYTEETFALFTEALTAAQAVLADTDATQAEVDEVLAALDAAYKGLKEKEIPVVDKADLAAKYNAVKNTDGENYTEETFNAFVLAVNNAKEVLMNENATQEEVDNALTALTAAYEALEEKEEEPQPPVEPAKNGWEKVDGKWYFYVEDVAQTGWVKDGAKWYFMDQDGVMQTGWIKDNNKWYYLNSHMMTGWQQIDGQWYYLNTHMITGWLNDGGQWYYLDSAMQTGWVKDNGKWYYLDSAMKTGWQFIDGEWWYLNSHMMTGWQKINGTWYYLNNSMVTGWLKVGDIWYYFNSKGAMVTGTQTINGKVYKFSSTGVWIG